MEYRAFWLPKRGHRIDEWEDAWSANSLRMRFAVADGASESAFAKSWAQCLVDRFKDGTGPAISWTDGIPAIQSDWTDGVQTQPLPWYAEAKLLQGAFATFLGMVVTSDDAASARWEAIAVGDSCLFQTRGGQLLTTFPLETADQFDNAPHLLGSRTPLDDIRANRLRTARGHGQPDDRWWLMTDALAHWCLAEHQAARNPWAWLESLLPSEFADETFSNRIDELRDRQQIRNDDVTLLAVWL